MAYHEIENSVFMQLTFFVSKCHGPTAGTLAAEYYSSHHNNTEIDQNAE
jgi:hypothetical protein